MKALRILNALLTLYIIQLVLIIPMLMFAFSSILKFEKNDMQAFKFINEANLVKDNFLLICIYFAICIVSYVVNIYGFILIRKCVTNFIKLDLFSLQNASYFIKSGWLFIGNFLVVKLFTIFMAIDLSSTINKFSFQFEDFILNPFNGLIIGILFLVIGKVFKIAFYQKQENINLKQENELTI
ncbi:DUF2975 domain-containing protein [Flavobacterium agricola]|uniref:DUF2975 domain-containing protein n=1 Tax=Flavobacterium agricola TaxID=2870839 RepID=A0ABY6M309_9FLAO|nr:DUF2975 domain-containing protein [Flavobacterium agricola]UYW01566.1 DUF2975 domain-containing protein [Flavobacterium agricola]